MSFRYVSTDIHEIMPRLNFEERRGVFLVLDYIEGREDYSNPSLDGTESVDRVHEELGTSMCAVAMKFGLLEVLDSPSSYGKPLYRITNMGRRFTRLGRKSPF